MKRIVFLSDTHCGSVFGLTPPKHFSSHHRALQEESWEAYKKMTLKWAKPDILVANGDLIEGTQSKQGAAELITPDRNIQVEMAEECLRAWDAKQIFLTYGTKYHVGEQAEDFEYNIAKTLKAKIEGRLFLNVEGLTFDIRHKVGMSIVPYGRATILLRDLAWDLIREAAGTGPKVDVVVRSHVHYHIFIEQPGKIAFTTPALQLARGRFGSRECVGETHWGAIQLTVHKGQIIKTDKDICLLRANRQQVIRVK